MLDNFPEVEGLQDFPNNIKEELLKEAQKYVSNESPYWIQIIGIPGSGKTTLVHMLKQVLHNRKTYTLAAFDEYMEKIPEYHLESDRSVAFKKFESPARAVGFEIFKELIKRKANVLFEHSTTFPAVRDLLYVIKSYGYKLILIQIEVDVEVAKKRVVAREKITSRHVPESLIEERANISLSRWEELSKISDVRFSVVNNGDQTPEDVFTSVVSDVSDFVGHLK